jgi:hypothetical protein
VVGRRVGWKECGELRRKDGEKDVESNEEEVWTRRLEAE